MEERRFESNSINRRHFARLHEKIQNKYEQMQRRLEKSKSIDSMMALNEDFVFKATKYSSNLDLSESDDVSISETESDKISIRHSVVIEDIQRNDATLHEVNFREASISEFEIDLPNDDNDKFFENKFFDENFCNASHESLNEVAKERDESLVASAPAPTPRISIRDKIGSRISAVKEKRRRDEKERSATKDKKKESREKVEKFILSNTTKQDIIRVYNKRIKTATVTIALIEATEAEKEATEEKVKFFNCRFRLGTDKFKSKSVKSNGPIFKWQELFNLNMYEESMLEIQLCDKDIQIGRSNIDLSEMEKEKTHRMRIKLEGDVANVQIFILLTISGTTLANTVIDLHDYQETQTRIDAITKKFAWYRLRDDYNDVGCLSIIVYGAKGLSANDCYCILNLGNERQQTHTEFKTSDPNWMKICTFTVTDITSILEVTVQDEKKDESAGKISIPLFRINNGKKKWYALKDNTQRERAKGNNPRILLEMRITWNLVKAAIRVINPKEINYLKIDGKLDRHVFARNISRAKAVISWTLSSLRIVKSCFEWESKKWNTIALAIWLPACWFFKVWMFPLLLLIPFIWYRPPKYCLTNWKKYILKETDSDINADDSIKDKEEKNTSLRQKISSLQEMIQTVQNFIGKFASLGESIKNLFNFTTPFLSGFAIFIILVIAFIMYLIPVRYIFIIWGVHKFTRKILRPNRIPNSEILDLLSRVPDDETMLNCEEFTLEEVSEEDKI